MLPRLLWGAGSALAASIVALSIPIALEGVVAGPIASGDARQIALGAVLVMLLGFAEAVLVWLRRWFVLGPSTAIEYDLRTRFTQRLQRLPVAFHDRWQSVSCSPA